MSKELTPLEAYNEFLDIIDVPVKSHLLNFNDKQTLERYRALRTQIETALKRLENYEQNEDFNKDVLNYAFLNEQDKIKKLKALEIIRELFHFGYLKFAYGQIVSAGTNDDSNYPLTQDKSDLLKEVLL